MIAALLIGGMWLALALTMEKRRKERARRWFYLKARAREHTALQLRGELK